MLFWFFPFVGTVLFLLSEKRSSCHRKSTVPTIGKALFRSPEKELFNFRSVASSDCQYVREPVTTGFI